MAWRDKAACQDTSVNALNVTTAYLVAGTMPKDTFCGPTNPYGGFPTYGNQRTPGNVNPEHR